jgi:hypothetical protein
MRRWWTWVAAALVIILAGYFGAQAWVDRQASARAEALPGKGQALEQEATGLRQSLAAERENLTRARADVTRAKQAAAQASKERDQALQSAIAAAAAREAIHGQVAQVPQSEVRGRVRAALARLGMVPGVGR